jgi:hypothetical protein
VHPNMRYRLEQAVNYHDEMAAFHRGQHEENMKAKAPAPGSEGGEVRDEKTDEEGRPRSRTRGAAAAELSSEKENRAAQPRQAGTDQAEGDQTTDKNTEQKTPDQHLADIHADTVKQLRSVLDNAGSTPAVVTARESRPVIRNTATVPPRVRR